MTDDERDELLECPHHMETELGDLVPGWVCPYGCGAFIRDDDYADPATYTEPGRPSFAELVNRDPR